MSNCQTRNMTGCCAASDQLQGYPLAMAYVPWQIWNQTYDLEKGLMYGTIFPELNKPFLGKRGGCK